MLACQSCTAPSGGWPWLLLQLFGDWLCLTCALPAALGHSHWERRGLLFREDLPPPGGLVEALVPINGWRWQHVTLSFTWHHLGALGLNRRWRQGWETLLRRVHGGWKQLCWQRYAQISVLVRQITCELQRTLSFLLWRSFKRQLSRIFYKTRTSVCRKKAFSSPTRMS